MLLISSLRRHALIEWSINILNNIKNDDITFYNGEPNRCEEHYISRRKYTTRCISWSTSLKLRNLFQEGKPGKKLILDKLIRLPTHFHLRLVGKKSILVHQCNISLNPKFHENFKFKCLNLIGLWELPLFGARNQKSQNRTQWNIKPCRLRKQMPKNELKFKRNILKNSS